MKNGQLAISMILVPLYWVIHIALFTASMIYFRYNKKKIQNLPIWAINKCSDYGKRMKNYFKCETCPIDRCESCSIETLRKRFKGSDKSLQVITTKGRKVRIS